MFFVSFLLCRLLSENTAAGFHKGKLDTKTPIIPLRQKKGEKTRESSLQMQLSQRGLEPEGYGEKSFHPLRTVWKSCVERRRRHLREMQGCKKCIMGRFFSEKYKIVLASPGVINLPQTTTCG